MIWTALNYPGAIYTRPWRKSGANIVGYYYDGLLNHGFSYNTNTETWTVLNYPDATNTYCYGIDGSNIVGVRDNFDSFLYNGNWIDIPRYLEATTFIYDIQGNTLVGYTPDMEGQPYGACGIIYNLGTGTWSYLKVPGSTKTCLYSIDGSIYAGYCYRDSKYSACYYNGSQWTVIDYPGASATFAYGCKEGILFGTYLLSGKLYGFIYNISSAKFTSFQYNGSATYTRIHNYSVIDGIGYITGHGDDDGFFNPILPEKPVDPIPTDDAIDVSINLAQVEWEDGGGADSFDVYFGLPGNLVYLGNTEDLFFTVSNLNYSIEYTWRIDAINEGGTTTGDVWSFTIENMPVPLKATNPTPANEAIDVDWLSRTISWENGGNATSYGVYFGVDLNNLQEVDTGVTETTYTIPYFYIEKSIWEGHTFYWRIDSTNNSGTTIGDVWHFTTEFAGWNPADILKEILTNTYYGAGVNVNIISNEDYLALRAYCDNEKIILSIVFDNQQPLLDWLNYIMTHYCGYIYMG